MFNYRKLFPVMVVIFIFLYGCGTWDNLTTYFNVYYNANLSFEQAMEDIQKTEKGIFEFKRERISSNADKLFTKVIEKCSAILQFHPNSKYFDDALLIIGQAYYYKENFSKALRKFNELSSIKSSEMLLENKLWIAKTELQLRNFEVGLNLIEEVKNESIIEEREDLLEQAYIAEISFLLFQEKYSESVSLIEKFIDVSENDITKANVLLQLGKIYQELEQHENALNAFNRIDDYSPIVETEFNGKLESAKSLKFLGKLDESLVILEDIEDENKFNPFLDKIELELGFLFYEKNELDLALDQFIEVDTTYDKTESAGLARYKLGEVWEYDFMNYDSADFYYKKAFSSKLPDEDKIIIRSKTQLFQKYFKLNNEKSSLEKKISWLEEPQLFVQDSIDFEELILQLAIDSAKVKESGTGTDLRVDKNSIEGQSMILLQKIRFNKPKRPILTIDSLKVLSASAKYSLGNLFFVEMGVLDSAFYYYNQVLNLYPNDKLIPDVNFALGSYYSTINDSLKADSVFNFVYDEYQGLKVAKDAANRLGIVEFDVSADSSAILFLQAEDSLLANKYDSAIKSLFVISEKYPESVLAPKALYTIGYILENEIKDLDSAAVIYDTLNVRYDKSLYAKEITTKLNFYNIEKKRKNFEKLAIEKAYQDSVNKANGIDLDSLKTAQKLKVSDSLVVKDSLLIKNDSLKTKLNLNEAKIDTTKSIREKEFLLKEKERLNKTKETRVDTLKEIKLKSN